MTEITPVAKKPGTALEGRDAKGEKALERNASSSDEKLDLELDESFPASDPPSSTEPKKGSDRKEESDASNADDLER